MSKEKEIELLFAVNLAVQPPIISIHHIGFDYMEDFSEILADVKSLGTYRAVRRFTGGYSLEERVEDAFYSPINEATRWLLEQYNLNDPNYQSPFRPSTARLRIRMSGIPDLGISIADGSHQQLGKLYRIINEEGLQLVSLALHGGRQDLNQQELQAIVDAVVLMVVPQSRWT
ncbi:hypothetical protein B0H10DRAFT_1957583 [Mycena sp. CBHHK59/15]|nr:hypothetical protein B0H10DRAFT_1957583 [Mycena sp. CBHHK59/15]